MKRLLFITLSVLLFGCCAGIDKGTNIYFRSYVMFYYEIEDVKLVGNPEQELISCRTIVSNNVGGYNSEGQMKMAYDLLCEKHADMTYDRFVKRFPPDPNICYPCVDFVSIDITSDSPYDESHPAGSSLANIIILDSFSAQPYIDSGYVMYDWGIDSQSESRKGLRPYYPVYKRVPDLTARDLMLLGDDNYSRSGSYLGVLRFDSSPTLSKTHKFTVTLTADDGRVFEDSIEMTFE